MRLGELLAALPPNCAPRSALAEDNVRPVRGLCIDSRRVAPGDLFVALRGAVSDGHDYLDQAIGLGAAALLVEEVPKSLESRRGPGPPIIVVSDTRRALAPLAARFYGNPSEELDLVGVTGTNGKTSTTYLVESMWKAAGRACGLIGTVETRFADEAYRSLNTTPESLELQQLLRAMRNRGVTDVVMEVSSHGLEIGRTTGCCFRVAAFTNLTQDHLDFHTTMERYRAAKLLLFRELVDATGTAVVNLEDPHAAHFVDAARERGARVLGVAREPRTDAQLWVCETAASLRDTRVRLAGETGELELSSPLLGSFNVDNLLVAVGIALATEVPPEAIARGVAACPQVPGRLERVDPGRADLPTVLVDYAHTPDAVEKLLAAVRPLATSRLITVFGCGGDRDRSKRAPMAAAVARHSDLAVLTSDNPRTEDPEAILDDVEVGLAGMTAVPAEALAEEERSYVRCADRREAIALAIRVARPDDTVVIAGKGHEDYQIVGRQRFPFDDRVEARQCLARRGAA
jgi:UDP-N-acetylmuramoyl-L-alanyl-D-glutamate--2,6-diaminopimelate ligase